MSRPLRAKSERHGVEKNRAIRTVKRIEKAPDTHALQPSAGLASVLRRSRKLRGVSASIGGAGGEVTASIANPET